MFLLSAAAYTVNAQSGSEVVMDSNDLYYNVINRRMPGVEVTYPNKLQSELWDGHEKPTGHIVFPKTIVYKGKCFEVCEISPWTFMGCEGVTGVELSDHLLRIGFSSFAFCEGLQRIEIPSSVNYIGGCAFLACKTLRTVSLPEGLKNLKNYTFADCPVLESLTLPASLETIGVGAFDRSGLTSITIPEKVYFIDINAFRRCRNLTSVKVMSKEPPAMGEGAFEEIAPDAVLYVPQGSREAYVTSEGWSLFSRVEEF